MEQQTFKCTCNAEANSLSQHQPVCPQYKATLPDLKQQFAGESHEIRQWVQFLLRLKDLFEPALRMQAQSDDRSQETVRSLREVLRTASGLLDTEVDAMRICATGCCTNTPDRMLSEIERETLRSSTGQDRIMLKRFGIISGTRGSMIDDDEFGYDAAIRVSGDFATTEEKEAYLKAIRDVLNENETRIPFRPRQTAIR